MTLFKKLFFLILLFGGLTVSVNSQAAESLDRIKAVVNTHVITQQQLSEQIEFTRQQLQAENKRINTFPLAST